MIYSETVTTLTNATEHCRWDVGLLGETVRMNVYARVTQFGRESNCINEALHLQRTTLALTTATNARRRASECIVILEALLSACSRLVGQPISSRSMEPLSEVTWQSNDLFTNSSPSLLL